MQWVLYADNEVVDIIEGIGLDDDMYCYSLKDAEISFKESAETNSDFLQETLKCNCPNCGAPIKSHTCEYCGTILDPIAMKKEQNELSSIETRLKCLRAQLSQAEQSATLLTGFSNLFIKNRKGY